MGDHTLLGESALAGMSGGNLCPKTGVMIYVVVKGIPVIVNIGTSVTGTRCHDLLLEANNE
jgi:hypothetical protein